MATAVAYRMKQGLSEADAASSLAGFTLGRLRLFAFAALRAGTVDVRGISAAQLAAGQRWSYICRRHQQLTTPVSQLKAKSGQFEHWIRGTGEDDEELTSEEKTTREKEDAYVRAMFPVCWDALANAARSASEPYKGRPGWPLIAVAYAACVENRPVETLTDRDCGNLRMALNALAKVLG